MKPTLLEVSNVLGLSKERVKQIVHDLSQSHPNLPIDKTSRQWTLGPKMVRSIFEARGVKIPKGKVVVFGSQKGGIGKTTLTVNTAGYLGAIGLKVLIIDSDPEGHASNMIAKDVEKRMSLPSLGNAFGENPMHIEDAIQQSRLPGVDFIQSSIRLVTFEKNLKENYPNPKTLMADKLKPLLEKYNIILIDVSPSYSLLSISSYLAANHIIIPTTPDVFALESIDLTIASIRDAAGKSESDKLNISVLCNNVVEHQKSSIDAMSHLMAKYPKILIPFSIRGSVDVRNSNNEGLLVFSTKNNELKDSFRRLALFVGEFSRKEKETEHREIGVNL